MLKAIIRPVRFPAMDGIRFVAATWVFLTHAFDALRIGYFHYPKDPGLNDGFWRRVLYFLGDGNHAVDIFFILSGFLMGREFYSKKDNFAYLGFLKKRLIRIYPAFFVSYPFVVMCDIQFGWKWSLSSFWAGFFFLNAYPKFGFQPYHFVSWSIGFEMMFYVIFPIALLIPMRLPAYVKPMLLTCGSLLLCIYVEEVSWLIRITGLFVGLWLGSIEQNSLKKIADRVPATIVLFLYILFLSYKNGLTYIHQYIIMMPILVMLVISASFGNNFLNNILSKSVPRLIGTISYSFYLYHVMSISIVVNRLVPIFGFRQSSSFVDVAAMILMSYAVSILFALISFKLIESAYFRWSLRSKHSPAQAERIS